jgi:hypothetical protein
VLIHGQLMLTAKLLKQAVGRAMTYHARASEQCGNVKSHTSASCELSYATLIGHS